MKNKLNLPTKIGLTFGLFILLDYDLGGMYVIISRMIVQ